LLQLEGRAGRNLNDMPRSRRNPALQVIRCAVASLLLVATAAAASQPQRYEFEVQLDGKPIGTHSFEVVAGAADARSIKSQASFDVRLLGITLYRYRHRAEEHWQAGCLQRIDALTSDNGREIAVRGQRAAAGFRLDAPSAQDFGGECVSSYAYWDPDRLLAQRELLNPQTGKLDAVRIEALGEEQLELRTGRQAARRYRLLGDELNIELWYSPDGRWLQLASTTSGNRRLLYRLRY
jgi:hypothetical protein